ncbi:MAG TPA: hypothetical protein VF212_13830 [Longimicrobiales bacterium]
MTDRPVAPLICPVCAEPLSADGRTLRCPRGHAFDEAREGYVDLLPAGHGRSRIRGDTAEMVRARRRFLERGHYDRIAAALEARVARHLTERAAAGEATRSTAGAPEATRRRAARMHRPTHATHERTGAPRAPADNPAGPAVPVILEVGCGEGIYIGRLSRSLAGAGDAGGIRDRATAGNEESAGSGIIEGSGIRAGSAGGRASENARIRCFGLDVSRDALRRAARAYPAVRFFRNDVKHRICLADASVDVLLDVFAPRNPAEFARVVRRRGLLLVAIPNERHLAELRTELPLLGIEPDKRERVAAQLGAAFRSVGEDVLEYRTEMTGDDVADLLRMTPNYWHLGEAELARAAELPPRAVTVAVTVLAFRRGAASVPPRSR